ncbi:MAG: hypothetical protein KGN36_14845, partial [Acidobacteriota bacterium]|nr:hypothetical protein [Acidobacteriota bacterium]
MRRVAVVFGVVAAVTAGAYYVPVSLRPVEGGGAAVREITSFEDGNPFEGGTLTGDHATDGKVALRIGHGYAAMRGAQDWRGYDVLEADVFVEGARPVELGVEIQDTGTRDYWTRVNYQTVAPPGQSTLQIPLRQLYVGEKARPGRRLLLGGIRRLVFAVGDHGAVYLDRVRLERDTAAEGVGFEGLRAFDFGTGTSPVMDGFTPVTEATEYRAERGYGLRGARVWKSMDVLQPDPLYEDYLCITAGEFVVDAPNGKYRVWMNLDGAGGYWGEYPAYRERTVRAQGREVVRERVDFGEFLRGYYRFWDTEDLPGQDTFAKYDAAHFSPKVFDVEVTNGRIELGFEGEKWANCVSAIVIYPVEKAAEGERFLEWVRAKRRFYFENSFKPVLHEAEGDALAATEEDRRRGMVVFERDFMDEVYYNDTPRRGERAGAIEGDGFAGENVPLTVAVLPLEDLGKGTLAVSELRGAGGRIGGGSIEVGYVSYRVTRVTADGGVYTIAPRWVIPRGTVALPQGVARRFWITVRVPEGAAPGVYEGEARITTQRGGEAALPVRFRVRRGKVAAVDVPAGPWGGAIGVPWAGEEARARGEESTAASLRMLRRYGFTMYSGAPEVMYHGFRGGAPVLDFGRADVEMEQAKRYGFLAVNSYGAGVIGIDGYRRDWARMKEAGFSDYSAFVKAVYGAIARHA